VEDEGQEAVASSVAADKRAGCVIEDKKCRATDCEREIVRLFQWIFDSFPTVEKGILRENSGQYLDSLSSKPLLSIHFLI
jgi:hypothetical protein